MKTPYELRVAARVGNQDEIRFRTADGVHSKQSLRDAALLLADELWERDPATTLVVDSDYGVVGTLVAPTTRVTATTTSARAGRLARLNAARAGRRVRVVVTADPTQLARRFAVAAYAPKPYTPLPMGRRRLLDSLRVLEPGGTLFVAARDEAGCARYESRLAAVGADPVERRERSGVRLLSATRPAEVTTDDPVVEPSRRTIQVADTTIRLVTVPGAFAAPGIDDGTRFLLDRLLDDTTRAPPVADDDRALDVCCGAGPIAAAVGRATRATVVATDDDPVAVACARRTIKASDADAIVRLGDCVTPVSGSFDRVVCNPPTHAGSGVLRELFAGIVRVLAPDGVCSLVHHRSLAFDEFLAPFDRVRDGACDGTYRIRHCR